MSKISLTNLRARLVAIILLASIPAFVLMLSVATIQRDRALSNARVEANVTARIVADYYVQLIATTEQLMRWMAHFPELQSDDPSACMARLAQLFAETTAYRGFSVARPNGEVFCSASSHLLTSPTNSLNLPYFQRALQKKDFVIGGFQVETASSVPNFTFGYPILDAASRVRAVIGAELDVEKLNQTVITTRLPSYATLLIIDRNGTVLVSYPEPKKYFGQTFPDAPLVQSVLRESEGSEETAGLDGVTRLYGFTSFGTTDQPDFHVAVGFLPEHVYAAVDSTLRNGLIGLSLIGLVALLAAWLSAEWMIVRPARAIVGAATRLREGDLSARTGLSSDTSELGELADTFDTMATVLQQRQLENTRFKAETEKLNQGLEQRVVARTAQLETSNTKLLESQAELRKLSQQLMHVTEQERTRIAREIHDQLGQALTAIKIELRTTQKRLEPSQTLVLKKLADVTDLVDETILVVRRIASDMRPGILDDFGLEAAAEWQLEEFEKRAGLRCHLSAQVDENKLDPELCTASFRILQEALTNVARHANAT